MAASRQTISPSAADAADALIGGRFRILAGSRLAPLGGHACVAAQDLRHGGDDEVVALQVEAAAPARASLAGFMQVRHEALIRPLAAGPLGASFWIIAAAPPGPSLASLAAPWSGNGLLTHLLRPVAAALDHLQMSGLTHRAIRPDNVFVREAGKSAVLGPCWMEPAASRQPAMFEPPYSAICAPAARGDGTIMDDVYALGVLLLALHTRAVPLDGLEPREIIQRKLELGSYAALVGQTRLAHNFEEILRAMLSDDPLARPTPAALVKLDAIHARRSAYHGTRHLGRPIKVGEQLACNRRMLALLCAEQPTEAMVLLRQGSIAHWLNRGADDADLAPMLEELRQEDLPADGRPPAAKRAAGASPESDFTLMRLIALLDPLAPLFWRGRWLWPDALGSILAASLAQPPPLAAQEASALLDDMLNRKLALRWRQVRGHQSDQGGPQLPSRLLRLPSHGDPQWFMLRIAYALNPYLACAAPKFAGGLIIELGGLLAALERLGGSPLLDVHCLAFLDARLEDADMDPEIASGIEVLRELWMLARCQRLVACGPLPRIAASLLQPLEIVLNDWPGVSRRQRRVAQVRGLAAAGNLEAMLLLFSDGIERREDEAARVRAMADMENIEALLAEQVLSTPQRLERSLGAARDTASAAGMLCIMAALCVELLNR